MIQRLREIWVILLITRDMYSEKRTYVLPYGFRCVSNAKQLVFKLAIFTTFHIISSANLLIAKPILCATQRRFVPGFLMMFLA